MAALKYQVNGEWRTLLTGVSYEVGDIFISTNATSPAARFGGVWAQLKDRFLVGAGSSYAVGETGGAGTVALTEGQMPKHHHVGVFVNGDAEYEVGYNSGSAVTTKAGYLNVTRGDCQFRLATGKSGNGSAHENRPPYLAVYMWQRIE